VRDLTPWPLVGLTATPHKRTPPEQIIYRYPLAAAIADRLVKTPVLVGRKDDRADPATKLLDGIRLLEAKRVAIEHYCAETGTKPVNPVMLVIAKSIDDADEYAELLRSSAFAQGRYADHVLVVHSKKPDEDLAQLQSVEDDASPVRIIVSVGMLKEGWDVKNVYVIASMRSSVSEILTEQTLGRGLRLPFGAYTDWELLDTLEVLAHERYEDLLRKARVINEAFIDYRTRAVLRRNAEGQEVSVIETEPVAVSVGVEVGAPEPAAGGDGPDGAGPLFTGTPQNYARPVIETVEERQERANAQVEVPELLPRARPGSTGHPRAPHDRGSEPVLAGRHHRPRSVPPPGRAPRPRSGGGNSAGSASRLTSYRPSTAFATPSCPRRAPSTASSLRPR